VECKVGVDALLGTLLTKESLSSYPVPANSMPTQEGTPVRGRPSGPVGSGAVTADYVPTTMTGSAAASDPDDGLRLLVTNGVPRPGPGRTRIARAADSLRAQQSTKR
jgi:hypothetical protein